MPNQDNWKLYYERTANKPARETLEIALGYFEKEALKGHAFDLGSGACNDVRTLLERGWTVTAVDNEKEAQNCFLQTIKNKNSASFQLASFEEIKWRECLLVHAGFALAFCPKEYFISVVSAIKKNLMPGGRFAGNFFGPKHTWQDLCLVSKVEIEEMFEDFEIEWIEESETNRLSTLKEEIYHHNISIVAKKTS